MIQDSGTRREFESGAVRDMAEGKGRCDLLPLIDVANLLTEDDTFFDASILKKIFNNIAGCIDESNSKQIRYGYAISAIKEFASMTCNSVFDLMLEVAIHYEEGAKKYDERNWEKGLPLWCFLDSATRHLLKYLDERNDEPHGRAFVWNMLGFMFTLRKAENIT